MGEVGETEHFLSSFSPLPKLVYQLSLYVIDAIPLDIISPKT